MTAISGLLDDTKYDATKSPAYTCSGNAILEKFRKWINSMMSKTYRRSTMKPQTKPTPQIPPPPPPRKTQLRRKSFLSVRERIMEDTLLCNPMNRATKTN